MDGLPLPTLVSQVLAAFTIEFDNEFERRMPHRTTNHGSTGGSTGGVRRGPWLVSLAMFENCMRFVPEEGITVRALAEAAHTKTNLKGMERWGYVSVERGTKGLVRPTAAGRRAQEVWRPLFDEIEKRWRVRFGEEAIDKARRCLSALVCQFHFQLPDCLPILGYGLFSKVRNPKRPMASECARLAFSALLSQVLLAFAVEFERGSELSLAICANVLRVLDEKCVRARDLPVLSGVSKEGIAMAMGILQKRGAVVVGPDEDQPRLKAVRLTAKGRRHQEAYRQRLGVVQESWRERFGKDAVHELRLSLVPLVSEPPAYPEGWRAQVPKPKTLPHYPMVLHRGGFPDGS